MTERLSPRELNRATLARQQLLGRVVSSAVDTIEHLAGMQAQAPLAPYVGLWTRLADFDADELSGLMKQRRVVRLHLMRNTVHLVSTRDCLDWHSLFGSLRHLHFGTYGRAGTEGVDRDAVAKEAARLLEQHPRSRAELREHLAQRWPRAEPDALVLVVGRDIPVCQIPPRGVWGKSGQVVLAPLEGWLGGSIRSVEVDELVVRYLGAFGPATVADVQLWSGLTKLREVVERLPLRTFVGQDGQQLYDLPDAPRPGEDIPAPPRFLPAYDNVLLSHKDRTRFIVAKRSVPLPPGNGDTAGTFLVDGIWHGTWQMREQALHIQPFTTLPRADRAALKAEARKLCSFVAPQSKYDLALHRPPC